MISFRRVSLQLFALVTLFGSLSLPAAAQSARGPSTPEERARILKIDADSRKDPIGVAAANGAWFEQWISDVPDVTLHPEAVAKWCVRSAKGELRKTIQFQFGVGAIAYQLAHNLPDPKQADDVSAVNLAALESVLAAYETLLAKDENNRSPKMDEALARRNKGELAAFAAAIAAQ